jgi:hypothetical protein
MDGFSAPFNHYIEKQEPNDPAMRAPDLSNGR